MATGAVPVRIRTATHFSSENSHRETLHLGRAFRLPWAFVGFTATLRYEPCIQFINVSQKALHIYFIDGCRRIKIERNNLLCEQAPTEVFRSIFAWLVTLNLHRYDNAAVIGVHAADAAGVHDQAIFELYLIRKKLFDGLGAARCITMGDHQCAVFGVSDFL